MGSLWGSAHLAAMHAIVEVEIPDTSNQLY